MSSQPVLQERVLVGLAVQSRIPHDEIHASKIRILNQDWSFALQ